MNTEHIKVTSLVIKDIERLDPITVHMQDISPGRGDVTIVCFGRAWTSYWGAMGCTVREFIVRCNALYLLDSFTQHQPSLSKRAQPHEDKYLLRIINAVRTALINQETT